MQVGPEDASIHVLDHLEQVMVIVPVDAQIDEAEGIAQKDRDRARFDDRLPLRSASFWMGFSAHPGAAPQGGLLSP